MSYGDNKRRRRGFALKGICDQERFIIEIPLAFTSEEAHKPEPHR